MTMQEAADLISRGEAAEAKAASIADFEEPPARRGDAPRPAGCPSWR